MSTQNAGIREERFMPEFLDEDRKKEEFEELALQYMDTIYWAAMRMAKNEEDAEDLVQEAYLRAYRFFDKFRKGSNFKAWLLKILRNVAINASIKARKTPPMYDVDRLADADILVSEATPENEIFNSLLDEELANAINALPECYRITLVLSDLEGLPYKEIAETLNCPEGTVMSRLHRGRKLLRKSLYEYAKKRGYV